MANIKIQDIFSVFENVAQLPKPILFHGERFTVSMFTVFIVLLVLDNTTTLGYEYLHADI